MLDSTNKITTERALLNSVITAAKENYAEQSAIWRDLERKAQGNIAVCGVLLAGILAFIRMFLTENLIQVPVLQSGVFWVFAPWVFKFVLTISIVYLFKSILLALQVLNVRECDSPPHAGAIQDMVTDLLDAGDVADPQRVCNLHYDQIASWSVANNSVADANAVKASDLWRAQRALCIAVFCVVTIPLISIWMK